MSQQNSYKSEKLTQLRMQAARFRWQIEPEPHGAGWRVYQSGKRGYDEYSSLDQVEAAINETRVEIDSKLERGKR